ncbi:MAG: hypothetical protein NTW95_11930 [Candidatus Aminicenantes bacterium]|nr:hypothetical protein [Candidatus Aminicenantes bacterium]
MTKKQQRWIALLVTLTFAWLLQVSTMPVAAAGTTEQIGAANSEQGPRYIEEEGNSGNQVKKKSILPIVLIGVGVVAVAAVLFLVVLKTSYDIRGTWTVHITYDDDDYEWNTTPVFTGDKKSGTTTDNWSGTGTYTVDVKNVTFSLRWPNNNTSTFTGQFDTKDTMSGRFHESLDWDGDWTAVRVASGASLPTVKNLAKKRGPNS